MDNLILVVRDVALILVLATLGVIVVDRLDRRALRVVHSTKGVDMERQQQMETLVRTLRWLVNVLILGAALMMLLSNFVDITPLLASVGVAGLAISLGAQTLIKDLIGGFLILVENQYAIGDVIQVSGVSGTVERLTLRVTHVRDISGDLHIVPNGEVRVVSNVTKGWSRALVEVGVAYEEDLDRVLQVLEAVGEELAQDPDFSSALLETPQVLGPLDLGDWAVTVRVTVKTRPGEQWEITRELKKRVLAACEREAIVLPYPRQEMWIRKLEPMPPETE